MKNRAACLLLLAVGTALFLNAVPCRAEPFLIDGYEPGSPEANMLKGKANVYQQAPSRIQAVRGVWQPAVGKGCLMLMYDKKGKGGSYDSGGWIGYYEVIGPSTRWFDASGFKAITFWVRGDTGKENFKVGVADRQKFEQDESVKSRPVTEYLPGKKMTVNWQKATVPLSEFFVYMKELASISFCIEGNFPKGEAAGRVYIDQLMLE